MDGYDDFEAEMLASGWSLEKIERVWQQQEQEHLQTTADASDYGIIYRCDDPFYDRYTGDSD